MFNRIKSWDNRILSKISKKHTPAMNRIMIAATALGNYGRIWFAFCLPFFFSKQWRNIGWTLLIALAISWFLSEIAIKHIVGRVRPCHGLDEKEMLRKPQTMYSFPSGHTATSFAITAVTSVMCLPLLLPVLIVSCLIAFSRMYLLAHYPTDVLAGAVLGLACGFVSIPLVSSVSFFNAA